MPDTVEIGGIHLTNYDASRMAKALRQQREVMTEDEIIGNTICLLPPPEETKVQRARQIIADLDEKVNNRG